MSDFDEEDIFQFPAMPQHPAEEAPLLWWRTKSLDRLRRYRADLLAHLETRTRDFVPATLINAALAKKSEAGLAIADRLWNEVEEDLPASWVCWAATENNDLARFAIGQLLLKRAMLLRGSKGDDEAMSQVDVLLDLMSQCFRRGMAPDFHSTWGQRVLSELLVRHREAVTALDPPAPKSDKEEFTDLDELAVRERLGITALPELQVVQAFPSTKIREHKTLYEEYAGLTVPLPLAGQNLEPAILGAALDMEFPWMCSAIKAIVADLTLLRAFGRPWVRLKPMLLDGPPGVGKTRFARRLARLVGTGFAQISAAGSSDDRMLRGTARGWGTAQPALPLLLMRQCGNANPVILVDEIDKAGGDGRNGDIQATLLTMLEPETAAAWHDECLLTHCDLSQVSWLLTSNKRRLLPEPLLSRLTVVEVDQPSPAHFDALLSGILMDIAENYQVPMSLLPPLAPVVEAKLRDKFIKGLSPRRLRAAVAGAIAAVAATVARDRRPT